MSHLHFYLLGSPRIERNGEPVKVSRRRVMALLTYLAVTNQSHRRQTLASLFWPDHDDGSARADLRRALYLIKKGIGEEWLAARGEVIRLNRGQNLWVDVEDFRDRLARHRSHACPVADPCPQCLAALTEAVALYHDDFLTRFSFQESFHFTRWQSQQAGELRCELAGALQSLVCCYDKRGAFPEAIATARRWLALDPLHELAHRRLMQLYVRSGRQTAALHQYQKCAHYLESELGTRPAEETTRLYEAIEAGRYERSTTLNRSFQPVPQDAIPFQGSWPANGTTVERTGQPGRLFPATSPAARTYNRFPSPATPFLGRREKLAHLLAKPGCRLVTLAGLGGMGKTRLACRAALENAAAFRDGVYFVSLADTPAADFIFTIAEALELPSHNGHKNLPGICHTLRNKEVLLVLDGFERLLDGAALHLAHMLHQTSALKILVTSRERLHLREEWSLDMQGMSFPQELINGEGWERYDAVQLFQQRAQQVCSTFSVPHELGWVVRICQLVEGMPLAIELAAAWTNIMSARAIAQKIELDFDFLTTPLNNTPRHHQSLRLVFDHTWTLLVEEEQKTLRRLSVFPGRFRYEAAEQVAGATPPLLSQLAGKSLLRPDDEGQCTLPRLVRQYAAEKLDQVPEEKKSVRTAAAELGISIDKRDVGDGFSG